MKKINYDNKIWILLIVSFLVRAFFASTIELGNDEVYYRIFGLYPELSYFDHPPLTAWLIRLTTMGSEHASELMTRFGAIVIGTINTYLAYLIVRRGRRGYIAALMYTASIYCSIIVGTFILPDSPLSLFWHLSLWAFDRALPRAEGFDHRKIIIAGFTVGLAMLAKYTGAYLWVGAICYLLMYNRACFKQWSLWVAMLISAIMFMPVLVWNFDNDWISFTFHGARVTTDTSINWLYFMREFVGGIFYNNPINYAIIAVAIIVVSQGKVVIRNFALTLWLSIPITVIFLIVSLTRETLPHWASPAFFSLILMSSGYLDTLKRGVRWAYISVSFNVLVMVVGYAQINYGIINLSNPTDTQEGRMGRSDFSLDTYGWTQGGEKFAQLYARDTLTGLMPVGASVLQYRWDDASHVDHYFALPLGLKVKTTGDLIDTHYYEWVTRYRGGLNRGEDAYLIIPSRSYDRDKEQQIAGLFADQLPADTIKIVRSGQHVMNFYVYRLKDYTGEKPDEK